MPKDKKRNIIGNSKRHAPLGQVIADDENKSKYATVRSRPTKNQDERNDLHDESGVGEILDEKTSKRILDLGREQLLEIEMEEQQEMNRRKVNAAKTRRVKDDSSDEEDDSNSILGDMEEEEE